MSPLVEIALAAHESRLSGLNGVANTMLGGFAVGLAIGAAIGAATSNFGLWLAMGVVIGAALERASSQRQKSED